MLSNLKFLFSKLIVKIQQPSIRDSVIHKTAKIGYRSNTINLKIGIHSYVGNNSSIVNTVIGNYCSIASYCSIGGGDHPKKWVSTSPFFYTNEESNKRGNTLNHYNSGKTVNIGNDVWIGEKCFIKDGVTIGNGAVLGAHSVVTKDIPDYAIAVGNPAKIINYRFNSKTINSLLKLKWWDFSEKELQINMHLISDPEKFINHYESKEDNS